MLDRVLADVVMVIHFGFLGFVAFGGFLSWRWPRWIVPHLAATGWGLASIVIGLVCPLTYLEELFRRRGGEPDLGAGFIDRYLENVVYPERYTPVVWGVVGLVVVISWAGFLLRRRPQRAALPS